MQNTTSAGNISTSRTGLQRIVSVATHECCLSLGADHAAADSWMGTAMDNGAKVQLINVIIASLLIRQFNAVEGAMALFQHA
jgi:hypothetical protein